jgi:hypothetical protein
MRRGDQQLGRDEWSFANWGGGGSCPRSWRQDGGAKRRKFDSTDARIVESAP